MLAPQWVSPSLPGVGGRKAGGTKGSSSLTEGCSTWLQLHTRWQLSPCPSSIHRGVGAYVNGLFL